MELTFNPATSAPAVLAALFSAQAIRLTKTEGGSAQFKGLDGSVVTGETAVLRAVGRTSSKALLGADAASEAEVDEWLEALNVDRNGAISKLNEALATRTYLAGYGFTVADFAAFAAVKSSGSSAAAQPNTARWLRMCEEAFPIAAAEKHVGVFATAVSAAGTPATAGAGSIPVAAAAPVVEGGKPKRGGTGRPADKPKAEPAESKNIGGGGAMGSMPRLVGAEMGKVVTRFPPEPSGYLHIGHVKALLLNDYYAKAYEGKMVIRFDDTNPSKEKEEYEENILRDLHSLDVKWCMVTHTSDYFDLIEETARKLIREGKAFMDDTPREEMQAERTAMKDSQHRNKTPEDNLALFNQMLLGGEVGGKWCLRAKMDMKEPNGTCRDPVLYRVNETPHHRTGTKYKAYPTYDLACPIVDALEGVTHALRSSEYHDRDKQYAILLEMMGLRKVLIQDFARLNFIYTLLSKRKLTWFVENKFVEGWNDARFPTVQGILRRGCTVPALREFILSQGASKRQIEMEWDKFWSINKKHLDPVAPRYTALPKEGLVKVTLTNGPAAPEYKTHPLHPKHPEVGVKAVLYTSAILLDGADVSGMKEGEEITLMKWGNAFIRSIVRDEASGRVVTATAELNPGGDVKKTERKVTWLPDSPDNVTLTTSEFDYLIKTPNLEEGGDFFAAINTVNKVDTVYVGEPGMRTLSPSDIIQIERKGFFRCDKAYMGEDRPAVLYLIPDGKVKGLFGLADRPGAIPTVPLSAMSTEGPRK